MEREVEEKSSSLPRHPKSEMMKCCIALLTSEHCLYWQILGKLSKSEKAELTQLKIRKLEGLGVGISKGKTDTHIIFGVQSSTLKLNCTIDTGEGINRGTLEKIINNANTFREAYQELFLKKHERLPEPLCDADFDPGKRTNIDKEQRIFDLAYKLGYWHFKEASLEPVIKNGQPVLNIDLAMESIDLIKNMAIKPNCAENLQAGTDSKNLFKHYKGVYSVYSVGSYAKGQSPQFAASTLRVFHYVEEGAVSKIRVKLNMPVKDNLKLRHQYRGYMIPIDNNRHLSMSLNLATETVNMEQHKETVKKEQRKETVKKEQHKEPSKIPERDTVNIICREMVKTEDDYPDNFGGIMSSLTQSKQGYECIPYASEILIVRKRFEGDIDVQQQKARNFMSKEGLHLCDNQNELLGKIADEEERRIVKAFFSKSKDRHLSLFVPSKEKHRP